MTFAVIVWRITTSFNEPYASAGYVVGNFIHTMFNDATLEVTVNIRDSSTPGGGTLVGTPLTGPNLFFVDGGIAQRITPDPLYGYCDGTTLKSIQHKNTFPYGSLDDTLNAVECQIAPVCDLQLSDTYTVVDSTGPANADGEIQVSGTSSNGQVRYSLSDNFDYASANTTGLFTGLISGDYTVYAKDELGCTDSIDINVPITIVYNPKFRHEYDDIRQGGTRIDILQRSYTGEVSEVCGSGASFSVRYNKDVNNKYDEIVFSEAKIELLTEVSEQFIELFQGDDREYQVRFYKFESDWVLKWVGYVVPEFYSEPFKFEPFYTTITAADNLKVVTDFDFYDENGNQFRESSNIIQIITRLLKQTGLLLNLRSCVNIYENAMDSGADDDSLEQTFFDPTIFYKADKTPETVNTVIRRLLRPFGARLFQSLGVWWIVRIEQSVGILEYREFNPDGEFVESGAYSPVVELINPRFNLIHWRDDNQRFELMQHYGKFTIEQNLGLDNNLIDSGSFEQEFLTSTGGGSFFFEGWNILAVNPGVKYGLEQVENSNSKGAFFMDWDSFFGLSTGDNQLYTKKIRVSGGNFTFKFQYLVDPAYNLPFIRIGYRVKATRVDTSQVLYALVLSGVGSLLDDSNGVDDWNESGYINDIYATTYGSFQTYEFSLLVPLGTPQGWDIEFTFYFDPYASLSGTDFSELRDIETSSRLQGRRRKYYSDQSDIANPILYDFLLVPSPLTESESVPDLIEPNDYAVGNRSRWQRQNTFSGAYPKKINKILIDNFIISEKIYVNNDGSYGLITPPNIIDHNVIANVYNFNKYKVQVFLGDLPPDDEIPNSSLIYDGFLRLEDGTPTSSWHRLGEADDKFILQILLGDLQAQLQSPTRKITGGVFSPIHLAYINAIHHVFENRKYMLNGYVLNDKQCSYEMDLIQVITGPDGEPPADTYEFTEEYTTEFDA